MSREELLSLWLAGVIIGAGALVILCAAVLVDRIGRLWAGRRTPWARFGEAPTLDYFDYLDVVDAAPNDETPDLSRGRGPVSVEAPGTALPMHSTPTARTRQDARSR